MRNRLCTALNGVAILLLLSLGLFVSVCVFSQTFAGQGTGVTASAERHSARVAQQQPQANSPTDPQLQSILDQMAAAGVLHPATLEEARRSYLFSTRFAGAPEHVLRLEDRTIPGPAGTIPIRLYSAQEDRNLPVWVFFHGGGFVTGSLDTHDTPLRAVANRCDCLVVSVGYRLAPEDPYPAATNDAYAATKWVAEHTLEIGGDPHRIAVGGDGAGGNLAAVVTLMARDRNGPHLIYQVLIYPILDAVMTTYSWVESADPVLTHDVMLTKWSVYVPINTSLDNPYISPANGQSLKNLPATLIITDVNDPLRDEVERYARELNSAGVATEISRYPGTIHGFFLMAGKLRAGERAIDQIASALKKTFASPR